MTSLTRLQVIEIAKFTEWLHAQYQKNTNESASAPRRSRRRHVEEFADDSGYEDGDDREISAKRPKRSRSNKRKYGKFAENSPSDAGSAEPPAKRKRLDDCPSRPQLLACPYFVHDPVRYSGSNTQEPNYRRCSSSILRDISRLKQHLYRCHTRPEYYCPQCYQMFESDSEAQSHERDPSACSPVPGAPCPFEEKATKEQMRAIKRRTPGVDLDTAWCSIYSILFPGEALPHSIYRGHRGAARNHSLQHANVARYAEIGLASAALLSQETSSSGNAVSPQASRAHQQVLSDSTVPRTLAEEMNMAVQYADFINYVERYFERCAEIYRDPLDPVRHASLPFAGTEWYPEFEELMTALVSSLLFSPGGPDAPQATHVHQLTPSESTESRFIVEEPNVTTVPATPAPIIPAHPPPPIDDSGVPTITITPASPESITAPFSTDEPNICDVLSSSRSPMPPDSLSSTDKQNVPSIQSVPALSEVDRALHCLGQLELAYIRPAAAAAATAATQSSASTNEGKVPYIALVSVPTEPSQLSPSVKEPNTSCLPTTPVSASSLTSATQAFDRVGFDAEYFDVGEWFDFEGTVDFDGDLISEVREVSALSSDPAEFLEANVCHKSRDRALLSPGLSTADSHDVQTEKHTYRNTLVIGADAEPDSSWGGQGADRGNGGDQDKTAVSFDSDLRPNHFQSTRTGAVEIVTDNDADAQSNGGAVQSMPLSMLNPETNTRDLANLNLHSAVESSSTEYARPPQRRASHRRSGKKGAELGTAASSVGSPEKAGQLEEPVFCVSYVICPSKCPSKCAGWHKSNVYAVQKHELTLHKSLYSADQLARIRAIGRTSRAEDRYLALLEIAGHKKYEGKGFPYRSLVLQNDSTAAVSKAALLHMGSAATMTSLEQLRLLETLQTALSEHFDQERASIRQDQLDAETELICHIRRALQLEAKNMLAQSNLAKCQAMSQLSMDFEQGISFDVNNMIARYTQDPSTKYIDRHRSLVGVLSLYPLAEGMGIRDLQGGTGAVLREGNVAPASIYCSCGLEFLWGCITCGKEFDIGVAIDDHTAEKDAAPATIP